MSAFNWGVIQARLDGYARAALQSGLDEMLRDAQDHAPVRKVFRGGRRPKEQLFADRGIKRLHKTAQTQDEFLQLVKKQRSKDRRFNIVSLDERGYPMQTGKLTRGSPYSFNPIVRGYSEAEPVFKRAYGYPRTAPQGEASLRDISDYKVGDGKIELPMRVLRGPTELAKPSTERRPPSLIQSAATPYLSSRGRAEIARQERILAKGLDPQANNSAFYTVGTRTTLGGRLRGEIYATKIHFSGTSYSGWVVSPTPYAKFQEYGTANHRAQPYMRPALYRMRTQFPLIVKRTFGRKAVY